MKKDRKREKRKKIKNNIKVIKNYLKIGKKKTI
jgi:hypothetical protein